MGAIFIKGAGASAAGGLTAVNGAKASYQSGSTTATATITADEACKVMVIFTRSNRNTSDQIRWIVSKNNVQVDNFIALTGGLSYETKEYDLEAGDTLTTAGTGTGYAGASSFFVASGTGSIH